MSYKSWRQIIDLNNRMKKVLIISWYFAPCSRMGAKRFGIMCKYFKENGYEPYVITAPASITGNGAKAVLEIPIPAENIIEVDFTEKSSYLTTVILELLGKLKLISRTLEPSHFWYKNVKETVELEQLRNRGFDIIIGTYGPMVNLYIAAYLSKKLKCKYIADIRDPISDYAEKLPQGYRWASKLDYIIEKISLSSVDGIVTANPKVKRDMYNRYPKKKIINVYNGWEDERIKYSDNINEKYLYFAGTLYEYMFDSLSLLFTALKDVNEKEQVKMIIRCVGSQSVRVKQIIKLMGMQEIVTCLPPVSEKIVREERQKSYINIVFSSIHRNKFDMSILPGKVYEYMHEKAPVLAVTLKDSMLSKLLRFADKGIGTSGKNEIVDFILNAGGKYEGNDNVLKFSRQYQTARLCRFMDYILEH